MNNNSNNEIYWTLLSHENWKIYVAASHVGLCYVGSQNHPFEELSSWVALKRPEVTIIQDDEKLQPYVGEIIEYLQGTRVSFTIPTDFQGTPFQVTVWNALCHIPYGQTF